jgi:hypothetical protein
MGGFILFLGGLSMKNMTKFTIVGMAALLGASLFFLGCPTDGDDPVEPTFSSTTNNSVANDAATLGFVGTSVSSSDEDVATAAIGGAGTADAGRIVITSKAAGTATITVYQTGDTEKYFGAKLPVTVAADGAITINSAGIVRGETSTATAYTLKDTHTGESADGSGLSIAYQRKGASNKVYIKLGGTVEPSYTYKAEPNTGTNGATKNDVAGANWNGDDAWYGEDEEDDLDPPDGVYAGVYLCGLIPAGSTNTAIRQENQALRFYTSWWSSNQLDTLPTGPKAADPSVYIPSVASETPVRWRVYGGPFSADDTLGFLMQSNAAEKQFKIDVDQYDAATDGASKTGDIIEVVVDYSAVHFTPALTLSRPTWTADTTPNAQNVNEMLERLWDSSAASTVQNITLGNVFSYAAGTKTLTVNKSNVTEDLKTWITTNWGGTSVPVEVTLATGTPSSTADVNWGGAYLEWIDVATVAAGNKTISLAGGGTESYTIAVTTP